MKLKLLVIFLITLLAYGLTIKMFVWQDDHGVMFKLQHISEPAGPFGTGIYDKSSLYRAVILWLYPIYLLFGLNTSAFYTFGILVYFLASICVVFFINTLTRDRNLAIGSGVLFASGYTGAETMWRIFNSIHTSISIALVCVCLALYKNFIDAKSQKRALIFFISSLLIFLVALETGFVRTHGLVLAIILLEVLWNSNIWKTPLRLLPFVYIFYKLYMFNNNTSTEMKVLLNNIFINQQFNLLSIPIQNLQNMIIPNIWMVSQTVFIIIIGIIFWRIKEKKLLIYSILFMLGSYLVYYIHTPTQVFPSIHRYFSVSIIGSALLLSLLISRYLPKKIYYLGIGIVALIHIVLVNKENLNFLKEITYPSINFFSASKKELPSISKDSIIYFDVKDDEKSLQRFGNFFGVGSMPDTTAIAWQYGIDRYDFFMPETFLEVLDLIKKQKTSIDKVFTLYFDSDTGIKNTTNQTRSFLKSVDSYLITNNLEEINYNYSSPIQISLTLDSQVDSTKVNYSKDNKIDLPLYLDYLADRALYYKTVIIKAQTEWMTERDINLTDNNPDTLWMGNRIDWHYNNIETIIIDLKTNKTVGAVKLQYSAMSRAPTAYYYQCSLDNSTWSDLGKFIFLPVINSGVIINKVPATLCRYIKFVITDSQGGDSPELAEIEVIDNKFSDIDLAIASSIQSNPFGFLRNSEDLNKLFSYISKQGVLTRACYYTDKSKTPFCQPLHIYPGSRMNYKFIISPNGTVLKSLQVLPVDHLNVKVERAQITPLSFAKLEELNYVPDYKEK